MNLKDMEKFEVKKVAGPIEGGAAVFLANPSRAFVVFVGLFEATAIVKELQKQATIRPLTHDLVYNILVGLDVEIQQVVISKIVDNTFCATLILEQKIMDESGNFSGRRNKVHVDARASDSIILALKAGKEIWVTREVYEKVEDVSQQLEMGNTPDPGKKSEKGTPWKGTELENIDFGTPEDDEEF